MEKLSHIFTNYIINRGFAEKESYEIYQYGFQTGLEILLNTFISIFIAIYLHMFLECIIFFLFFIPLRAYAGGIHMNRYFTCLICSCSLLAGVFLLSKYINVPATISLYIFTVSLFFLKVFGSSKNSNRLVDDLEEEYFDRKLNITILVVILFFLIFFVLKSNRILFLISNIAALVTISNLLGKLKYKIEMRGMES